MTKDKVIEGLNAEHKKNSWSFSSRRKYKILNVPSKSENYGVETDLFLCELFKYISPTNGKEFSEEGAV